ncbi:hypothetical protein ACFYPC_27360 [Streptomyces sp. NPDC005808]
MAETLATQPPPGAAPAADDVVLVANVATLIAETLPGCNDDNP